VLSVCLFDVGAIVVNRIGLTSSAELVAGDISTSLENGDLGAFDLQGVRARAAELAGRDGARLLNVRLSRAGVVRVRLQREAKTLMAGRIGPLRDYVVTTARGRASTT
jgi:hypothetical protein